MSYAYDIALLIIYIISLIYATITGEMSILLASTALIIQQIRILIMKYLIFLQGALVEIQMYILEETNAIKNNK